MYLQSPSSSITFLQNTIPDIESELYRFFAKQIDYNFYHFLEIFLKMTNNYPSILARVTHSVTVTMTIVYSKEDKESFDLMTFYFFL